MLQQNDVATTKGNIKNWLTLDENAANHYGDKLAAFDDDLRRVIEEYDGEIGHEDRR